MEQADLIPDDAEIYHSFLATLHSKRTADIYRRWIVYVLENPPSLLNLERKNRWQAQQVLINYILKRRDELAPTTMRSTMAAVRSFCEYAELDLPWRKILRVLKKVHLVGDDKPMPFELAQRLYDTSDLRMKWILSLFMSGIRVGAFENLALKQLEILEVEKMMIGILRVYPKEPEEYSAFLSSEGISNWFAYRKFREAHGEVLKPESPLVRNVFDPREGFHRIRPIAPGTIRCLMKAEWNKLGYQERDFKSCHGFRKLFRTGMETPGKCDREDLEHILGHKDAYYKPDLKEHFLLEFRRACHAVSLSKEHQANLDLAKVTEQKKDLEDNLTKELRLIRVENENLHRDMKERMERLETAYQDSL